MALTGVTLRNLKHSKLLMTRSKNGVEAEDLGDNLGDYEILECVDEYD
jgi:hypothetical protein